MLRHISAPAIIVGSRSFSSGFAFSEFPVSPNNSLSSSSIDRDGSSCSYSASVSAAGAGCSAGISGFFGSSGSIFSTAILLTVFRFSIILSQLKSTSSVFLGCEDGKPSRFQSKDTGSLFFDAALGFSVVLRISCVLLSASILKGGLKTTSSYRACLGSFTSAPQ